MLDKKFVQLLERMPVLLGELMSCPPCGAGNDLPSDIPKRGVYLFSNGEVHKYVGRTNRLRSRYREHCSGNNNDAPFAFKLARLATDNPKGNGKTRTDLERDSVFAAAFEMAKKDIRQMVFRWVAINDPNEQCLFEIYATLALDAKHNDFENH